MQEDLITNREDKNLNSNIKATGEGEKQEANKVFTFEEVEAMKKELAGNSEKGVQKVISEKKTFEKALKESGRVGANPVRLIELYDEDPKVAQIILDEFFEGQSIEEYKESIEYEEDLTDPAIIQKKIKEEAVKLAEAEKLKALNDKIEAEKGEFISKLKMTDEEKTLFEETFDELRNVKSFNTKDLTKQFEKAYRLSNDNTESLKKLKEQEIIGKAMTTGEGKNASGINKSNTERNSEYNKNFLKSRGII